MTKTVDGAEALANLTRPIIGIEYRSGDEAFAIMVDRIRSGFPAHSAALVAENERLRGLLIDPGDPAWEDARAVLVAELRKAEMPNHAGAVAEGDGAYIPSWMALNLIATAARTALETRNG